MAIDGTIDRRGLFSGAAAALVGGRLSLGRGRPERTEGLDATLLSAARIGDTDGGLVIDAEGVTIFAIPARGHAIAKLAGSTALLVGRRPGSFAAIVDAEAPDRAPHVFAPIAGHRFAGHAALSPDGRRLATSEIDAETGIGAVVLRNPQNGAPMASFPVGIEPHDLLFAKDGARLVIAVGGIARAADVKGPAMNAGNIESALAELDPRSGKELKRHTLPIALRSLSLRHMALAPDGQTVAFGMQDQDRATLRPLMGLLRIGQGVDLLPLPADDEGSLRSYIGSVAIDPSGAYVAATSPKGGMAGLWRLADGRWLGGFRLKDVCGLAGDRNSATFWATSGLGDIVKLRASEDGLAADAQWRSAAAFDNHLLRL